MTLTACRTARAVCKEMGGQWDRIMSATRGSPADVRRRRVAMYVFAHLSKGWPETRINYSAVGREFGRDRATVRESLAWVKSRLGVDLELTMQIALIPLALPAPKAEAE